MDKFIKAKKSLEFDKICERVAHFAKCDGAKKMALEMMPSNNREDVLRMQNETSDAKKLLIFKGLPPISGIKNLSEMLTRAQKGSSLSPAELLEVASAWRTARATREYAAKDKAFDTSLDGYFSALSQNKYLEEKISLSIENEDTVADTASNTLADIRRKMRHAQNKVRDILQKYITSPQYSKVLQENLITMRSGRYVIPVKLEYKNEVKGLVHDTSASGATLFIEPVGCVEANNEIKILQRQEEEEIERILALLSSYVADSANELMINYHSLVNLSFIFAKAEYSQSINAVQATLSENQELYIKTARHPLLDKEKTVPVDIMLGGKFTTLVITGPNTGGKTVTLKTVGLFSLMFQAGLHIPADESSYMCIFGDVLADIGDEQSIEQSLSTFSAHMVNIVSILSRVENNSLVLFDELGAGTDPVEGAALALAILEKIREKGALCCATTHYAELKAYSVETDGVCNASCEFDVNTLKPTYKLVIGVPGKSCAFAISEKLGLDKEIIEKANSFVSGEDRHFESVISSLEETRIKMDRESDEAARIKREFEAYRIKSEAEIAEKLKRADEILQKAQNQADKIVVSARSTSEFIFAELERAKKDKEKETFAKTLESARSEVRRALKNNAAESRIEADVPQNYSPSRPIKKGDDVVVISINKKAVVLNDPDASGNVEIRAGLITMKTKVDNLMLLSDMGVMFIDTQGKKKKISEYKESAPKTVSGEISLRGLYADDACFMLDKYIDEAKMAHFSSIRIIHGKGTGVLRKAVQDFLKSDKRIKSFRIGQYGEGDSGVTIAELK